MRAFIICLGFIFVVFQEPLWADLKVVPARTEDASVVGRALGDPAAPEAPAGRQATGSRAPAENFGKVVSTEAKVFRTDPIPGYRNFGAWVSSQRRHHPGQPCGYPSGGSPPSSASSSRGPASSSPGATTSAPAPSSPATSVLNKP